MWLTLINIFPRRPFLNTHLLTKQPPRKQDTTSGEAPSQLLTLLWGPISRYDRVALKTLGCQYWCLKHFSSISVSLANTYTRTHTLHFPFLVKYRMCGWRTKQVFFFFFFPPLLLPGMLYGPCEYWSSPAGKIAWFNQASHCLVKSLHFVQCHAFCSQWPVLCSVPALGEVA